MVDSAFDQFQGLWLRIGAKGDALKVFNNLERCYSEKGRRYHTMEHVLWALKRLKEIAPNASPEAEWALWFHDAVLARSPDDEAQSADLAVLTALHCGLGESFARRAEQLIRGTAHDAPEFDGDAQAVCDADLSVLGASDAAFDGYEAKVRTEWQDVPESAFRTGRIAVLRRFLGRESIYQTQAARERWEAKARANLERSIARLGSGAAIPTEEEPELS